MSPHVPPAPWWASSRAGNARPWGRLSSSGYWPGFHFSKKPQPLAWGILFPWKREQAGNEENAAPLVSDLPNAEGSGRHFPVQLGLRRSSTGHLQSRGFLGRRGCPKPRTLQGGRRVGLLQPPILILQQVPTQKWLHTTTPWLPGGDPRAAAPSAPRRQLAEGPGSHAGSGLGLCLTGNGDGKCHLALAAAPAPRRLP